MTSKKQRQKLARHIRKSVKGALEYPECFSLAKALFNGGGWRIKEWALKRNFSLTEVIHCSCCGPDHYRVDVRGTILVIVDRHYKVFPLA